MNHQIRQGDVKLTAVDQPSSIQWDVVGNQYIVAHGESGNQHTMTCPAPIKRAILGGVEFYYLEEDGIITHGGTGGDPHNAQVVPKGIYRRSIQRAYDPMDRIIKEVRD